MLIIGMVVVPKKATTIILLRNKPSAEFEAFLLKRHEKSNFMAGNYVYPGGRIDREDHHLGICPHCSGRTLSDTRKILGGGLSPEESLACWIAGKAERILGEKDSPNIVIDEVTGYLVAMAWLPPSPACLAAGFLFFRVLDIIKPPPAGWINTQMTGGLAVVLDDAVAGMYTNLLLRLIGYYFPNFFFLQGG